jgi:hypothetical protein
MGTGGSFPGGKAGNSPPFRAEVKNACGCTSTPQYVFMAWYMVKDNFTFIFDFNKRQGI